MPEPPPVTEQTLPWSVTLFAPWRWWGRLRLWQRYVIVVLLLSIAYIEAPILILAGAVTTRHDLQDYWLVRIAIEPLMIVHRNTTSGRWFYDTQAKTVIWLIKPRQDRRES